MATNPVQYGNRTFSQIKADLIALIERQYPEILNDFTDSSVGAIMIDLNAGVGNNLSVNIDRVFQETQLEYAQQRSSILNIAKNMGFNIPAQRPSATVVDITVTIPVRGDRPNDAYYPTLSPGAQIIGGGKIFETQEIIDWSSPVSNLGDKNRAIVPNLDSNGIVISYNVTKREVVVNGATNIYKKVITPNEARPFYSIILPDPDVIEIESIILLEGTNYSANPSVAEFYNEENRYYEVDYLAQQKVFIEDTNSPIDDNDGIKAARWKNITKKFYKEFTNNGFCKITFGSGDSESQPFEEGFLKQGITNRQFLDNFLKNTALGEQLKSNHTLFIRYRTGGGSNSNMGSKTLTQFGAFQLNVLGPRQDFNREVERSISVTNPIPAIGGNDGLSIEQIRQLIKYNFSSQNRDVQLTDYLLQVYKMPGKFGSPFKANAYKENNKIVIPILGKNSEGRLTNTSTNLLKENLTEYLSGYRMINDYVQVKDGKILNLAFDIDVYASNISDTQITNNIVSTVRDYLDVINYEMNTDIRLTELENKISEVNGVLNVIEIKVFNKVGGQYSNNVTSQEILNVNTGEIKKINNTIYSTKDSMFEIKYPEKDIKVLLRKNTNNS